MSATAVPGAATADTAPTLTGPSVVRYWTQFTLSGTATASSTVQLSYRRAGTKTFFPGPTTTAGTDGTYQFTLSIDASYSYYATDAGLSSPVVNVGVKAPSCSTSGPVVTKFPFSTTRPSPPPRVYKPFVAFSATRKGHWAGVGFDGYDTMYVVTWASGQPLHVLDHFTYTNGQLAPDYSVRVVAITPSGAVVATVQPTNTKLDDRRLVGYVYQNGKRTQLSQSPHWRRVQPVGVTDSGAIVGWGDGYDSAHHLQNWVIRWASPTAPPHALVTTGDTATYPVVDGEGDVTYYDSTGGTKVRFAGGQTADLAPLPGGLTYAVDTSYGPAMFFGHSDGAGIPYDAVAVWHIPATPPAGPIAPVRMTGKLQNEWVLAAGPHAEFVTGLNVPAHMRTPSGTFARTPSVLSNINSTNPGLAINENDTLAFTASDGWVHFFSCH